MNPGVVLAFFLLAGTPLTEDEARTAQEVAEAEEGQEEEGEAEEGITENEETEEAEDAEDADPLADPTPRKPQHLSTYKPNYFLFGAGGDTQVAFQFSFRYDLLPSATWVSVYFGYTQRSFWDLYEGSAPFSENNYNPEINFRWNFFPVIGTTSRGDL